MLKGVHKERNVDFISTLRFMDYIYYDPVYLSDFYDLFYSILYIKVCCDYRQE